MGTIHLLLTVDNAVEISAYIANTRFASIGQQHGTDLVIQSQSCHVFLQLLVYTDLIIIVLENLTNILEISKCVKYILEGTFKAI